MRGRARFYLLRRQKETGGEGAVEYYVHNKPNYKMYFILSVFPLYVGYCLGKLYGGRIGIETAIPCRFVFSGVIRMKPPARSTASHFSKAQSFSRKPV